MIFGDLDSMISGSAFCHEFAQISIPSFRQPVAFHIAPFIATSGKDFLRYKGPREALALVTKRSPSSLFTRRPRIANSPVVAPGRTPIAHNCRPLLR